MRRKRDEERDIPIFEIILIVMVIALITCLVVVIPPAIDHAVASLSNVSIFKLILVFMILFVFASLFGAVG